MHERDLWWKIVLVGVLSALGFAASYPLDKKIKYGIDLAGGYSLLYELDDRGMEGQSQADLSARVIEVLRRRVDPNGVFNLVWRSVGSNRIEIQMPAPGKEVTRARREYEKIQQKLQDTILRRSTVISAIARSQDRQKDFAELAQGVASRLDLLMAAAKAYDDLKAVEPLARDNDKTREKVLAALALPADQRAAAIEPIIAELPERRDAMDALVKAYDEFKAAEAAQAAAGPTSQPAIDDLNAKRSLYEVSLQKVLDVALDRSLELETKFDAAVGAVVNTNLDVNRLQSILEMRPKDSERATAIDELTSQFPGLADLIRQLVEQDLVLREKRKAGEGRLEDPADLQRLLKGAGVLEFRIIPTVAADPALESYRADLKRRGPSPKPGEQSYQWFEIEDPADFLNIRNPKEMKQLETDFERRKMSLGVVVERSGDKYYVLSHIADGYTMTHSAKADEADWSLVSAHQARDESGAPAIGFQLDPVGGTKFGPLTRQHRGSQLCIFIDDEAISHARINSPITTNGIIQGRFTSREVQEMVKKLNAGSLPQKLKDPPISVRAIGSSLGQANKEAGLRAAVIGAIAVAVFMVFYYRYAGIVAVIAVGLNILFTFAMMSMLGATLTLPGIAGLVLAIGMGVDANVLINERIREELNRGTAFRMSVKLGYERAFSAILDSNVTTVLTCIILYLIGSEQIKGFGLTLGVGVFINTFTAYFVSRMFFEIMSMISVPREVFRNPLLIGVAITLGGGILYGLGYALNAPELRETSSLMAFGQSLIDVGPAVLILLALMWLMRMIHANRKTLPMASLIGVPSINWIAGRKVFITISAVLVIGSVGLFISLPEKDLYDIEFLGGVNAQIDIKKDGTIGKLDSVVKQQEAINKALKASGDKLANYATAISQATLTGASGTYTLSTPGVPAGRLAPLLRDVDSLQDHLSGQDGISYSDPASTVITLHTRDAAELKADTLLTDLQKRVSDAATNIADSQIQAISGIEAGAQEVDEASGQSFTIVTRETAKDVVVEAIMDTLENDLNIQPALTFNLLKDPNEGSNPYFAIRESDPKTLGVPMTDTEAASLELQGWEGGVAIVLDDVDPPQAIGVLQGRLKSMRLQPDFEKYGWRESKVFGLKPTPDNPNLFSRVMVAVRDENHPMFDEQGGIAGTWRQMVAEPEVKLLTEALQRQTSLNQVTQFDREVSGEAKIQAYVALALSWLVIIAYLWFRFGSVRWGAAAVIALVHDATIALGAVALTAVIGGTAIGNLLMIDGTFRIDLSVVAALLTIIGFSVNDTIVIFDRIRENRGRLKEINADIVNTAINQTLSRTVLTTLTALMTVFIMYVWGGRGIHSINYALVVGMCVGTYSTIAIASQFVLRRAQLATVKA